jgi:hypothetical protein
MTTFCFGVYIVNESMGRTVESSLEFTGIFLNKDRIPQYKGELHPVPVEQFLKRYIFGNIPQSRQSAKLFLLEPECFNFKGCG